MAGDFIAYMGVKKTAFHTAQLLPGAVQVFSRA